MKLSALLLTAAIILAPLHALASYTDTTYTTGSVLFADVNGDPGQDNANLFWDDANNRLGIGVAATPTVALDVAGVGQFSGGIQLKGSTSGVCTLKASATTTSHTLNLPAAQGAANTYLRNDGSGNLTWVYPQLTNFPLTSTTAYSAGTTAAVITGMTTSPALAGTYSVVFSAALTNASATGNVMSVAIYVNGTQVPVTIRQVTTVIPLLGALSPLSISTNAIVTITAAQSIAVWGASSTGTITVGSREMDVVRLQ